MLWLGLRSRLGPRAARRRAFLEIVMPPGAVTADQADRLADELAPLFGHDLADQPPIAMQQLAGIPTLVVSATHDPIAPPRFGRALAAAIPGARFVEFPGASHGLPIQHADAVNALLIEHLTRAESARRTY